MKRNHRNLRVWQSAVDLVDDVYRVTAKFPKEELYGLSSQMRRAAVSVPSNIAEGCARVGTKELIHFLNIAVDRFLNWTPNSKLPSVRVTLPMRSH